MGPSCQSTTMVVQLWLLICRVGRTSQYPHRRPLPPGASRFATGEELAAFFDPGRRHHAAPNALFPDGNVRHLAGLSLARESRAAQALTAQHFEVINALAPGDQVALEVSGPARRPLPSATCPQGSTCGPASRLSSNSATERSSLSATTTVTSASALRPRAKPTDKARAGGARPEHGISQHGRSQHKHRPHHTDRLSHHAPGTRNGRHCTPNRRNHHPGQPSRSERWRSGARV